VIDERDYVKKVEWNVYDDFERTRAACKQPEVYSKIEM